MKTKHTPGPWSLLEDNSFVICAPSGKPIAEAVGVNYHESGIGAGSIQAANARLMAAAPELLDGLKKLQGWLKDKYVIEKSGTCRAGFAHYVEFCDDLIEKAEGGTR